MIYRYGVMLSVDFGRLCHKVLMSAQDRNVVLLTFSDIII